jgi:hypothetical protein
MIVTEAQEIAAAVHAPATIDNDAEKPTRRSRRSSSHLQRSRDRRQTIRCSDVANYPATAAFSNSTYKIYAVGRQKKYKRNIFNRLCG